jgi:hypothetical protein
MHSNLAKHLHTEECVILINEYENCNKEVFKRFLSILIHKKEKFLNDSSFFFSILINAILAFAMIFK